MNFYAYNSVKSTITFSKKNYCCLLTLLVVCLGIAPHSLRATDNIASKVESANIAIQERLAYYNNTFPEIQFAHLKNSQEWYQSLQALELFIGYQATSLDYEHPADLREDLLFATVYKIQLMLSHRMTSSFLFRVGQMPVAKRKHVCVITLDPEAMFISNRAATAYFIDIPLDGVQDSRFIDKDKHLDFIIDHEAFHCIDSFLHGGIPMSEKTFFTRYDIYRREIQADMFALAMHIQRHKRETDYVTKIIQLRGMSLLNGELQHCSAEGMLRIKQYDHTAINDSSVEQLLTLVKQIYSPLALSYQQYLQYRVDAVEAIQELGKTVNEYDKPVLPDNLVPQQEKVRYMIQQTIKYYEAFLGTPYTFSE